MPRRFIAAALFTLLLVALVNLAWWIYYSRTADLLEEQLNRRLTVIATTVAGSLSNRQLAGLTEGDFEIYIQLAEYLETIRQSDSLSELFILDENHRYLITTLLEPDSVYLLRDLNGPYIDSLFFDPIRNLAVPPAYQTGDLRLKSAFTSLRDEEGVPTVVLGVEADVDYYESLAELKTIFLYASGISVLGGLLLGLAFLLLERRIAGMERQLFLNQTNAYLGRMVAVVAHELKNPLMIMRASAERLRKKTDADEATYVMEEVDRLNGIVSGYLEFARAGDGLVQRDELVVFNLGELIVDLKKQFAGRETGREVEWLNLTVEPTNIEGYRRSLRQVLLNLLGNGADACAAANRPVRLGIAVERIDDDRVIITVSDTGSGIAKSQLEALFDPFHTTKQDGSGLGLFLSKKIVEEMGGRIHISSELNRGTDIKLTIPSKQSR